MHPITAIDRELARLHAELDTLSSDDSGYETVLDKIGDLNDHLANITNKILSSLSREDIKKYLDHDTAGGTPDPGANTGGAYNVPIVDFASGKAVEHVERSEPLATGGAVGTFHHG